MRRLTARQTQVLAALASGRTYTEAAHELGLSTSTIRGHVNDIHKRLGVTCLAEALAAVGWLTIPARSSSPSPDALVMGRVNREPSAVGR